MTKRKTLGIAASIAFVAGAIAVFGYDNYGKNELKDIPTFTIIHYSSDYSKNKKPMTQVSLDGFQDVCFQMKSIFHHPQGKSPITVECSLAPFDDLEKKIVNPYDPYDPEMKYITSHSQREQFLSESKKQK